MIFDVPLFHYRWAKLTMVVVVFWGLAYFDFASFYSLGYSEIYKHGRHGIAISLWVLLGLFEVLMFIYWPLIFIIGPGKAPLIPPFNIYGAPQNEGDSESIPTPDIFLCDESGYPYFCSNSKSMAINRSHFSKDLQYSVLRFDHYCIWIGTVIGESNYMLFLKYTLAAWSLLLVTFGYLIRFTRPSIDHGGINGNFCALYVLCVFWLIMLGALIVVHLRYVCINMTTLDEITINSRKVYLRWKKRNEGRTKKERMPRVELGKRYVNVKSGDRRLVIEYDIVQRPFDMGWKRNWINLVFNGYRNHGRPAEYYTTTKALVAMMVIIIPLIDIPFAFKYRHRSDKSLSTYDSYSSEFAPAFLQYLDTKIDIGEYTLASYTREKEE